jgi:hypothetical protein
LADFPTSVSKGRTPDCGVRYTRKNQKRLLNKIHHLFLEELGTSWLSYEWEITKAKPSDECV